MGIWIPTSTFGTWGIGDLWKLDGTNYYANRTLCCEVIFDMMREFIITFKEEATMLGTTMPKFNEPKIGFGWKHITMAKKCCHASIIFQNFATFNFHQANIKR